MRSTKRSSFLSEFDRVCSICRTEWEKSSNKNLFCPSLPSRLLSRFECLSSSIFSLRKRFSRPFFLSFALSEIPFHALSFERREKGSKSKPNKEVSPTSSKAHRKPLIFYDDRPLFLPFLSFFPPFDAMTSFFSFPEWKLAINGEREKWWKTNPNKALFKRRKQKQETYFLMRCNIQRTKRLPFCQISRVEGGTYLNANLPDEKKNSWVQKPGIIIFKHIYLHTWKKI